jgi:NADP-dependent 3-hydroxy acid dehydrogenase YdfG
MKLKGKIAFITEASAGIGAAKATTLAGKGARLLVRSHGDAGKAAKVYKGIMPLNGDDIADVILWAVTRPEHVNIARVSLTSVNQANTLLIHREQ